MIEERNNVFFRKMVKNFDIFLAVNKTSATFALANDGGL